MDSHVTMKYKKKLRLLVTNKCSRNCAYCHNEGMKKRPFAHLKPEEILPFLPDIKKYTNRIVLSGGEPFEYEYLNELTELLSLYGFDLSIITANIDKELLLDIGHRIKTIHYSIHATDKMDATDRLVRWLNDAFPNIRISLNIPFCNLDDIMEKWDRLYRLAVDVGANIQLIRIFSLNSKSESLWNERWGKLEHFLEKKVRFLEATERERRFITKELIKIDLLDIPCLASGLEFSDGACLNNSDITIDPWLRVSVCRWTDSAISLYQQENPVYFSDAVRKATESSCAACLFGSIDGYLHRNQLDEYSNLPHYTWPVIRGRLRNSFETTFESDLSYYGKSGSVSLLENTFSNYIGAKYALTTNSGTAAIFLACKALGLSSGDEVVIPISTFPTLIAALLSTGVQVRLCDIDPVTGNISPDSLQKSMGPRVKAVLVTHLWGLPADMDAIMDICHKHGAYIIEDCSHAYGAEFCGRKVGSFGDVACFSMQANKAVYSGEGGFLLTSDRGVYERAVVLSSSVERILDCVKSPNYLKYWSTGLGSKLKLNPLGAPLALRALKDLDFVNSERQRRVLLMEKSAVESDVFLAPKMSAQMKRVYYTYKLILHERFIPYRDIILSSLIHQGLEATITSFIPAYEHELSVHTDVVNGKAQFPNAKKYYSRIISLPAFVYEPTELAQYYAEKIVVVAERFRKGISGV